MQNMSGLKPGKFVRLCNSYYEGGKMVPLDEWYQHVKNPNTDWYRSVGTYTPEQVEIFKSQKSLLKPGAKGEGKVAGITGVYSNYLVLDFDSKDDLERARKAAIDVISNLNAYTSPEHYNITFTGSKGFTIELYLDKEYTSRELRAIAENLAGNLREWDTSLYDENQLIRVVGTRHPDTGLYKIPLSVQQIETLSIDEIKTLAKTPGELEWTEYPNKLPEALFVPKRKTPERKEVNLNGELDFKSNTLGMPNWKFAILHGFFPPGKRHDSMLALAAYFKGAGFPIEVTKNMVFEASRLQFERNKDYYKFDPTDEGELSRTIEHIYGPTWTGGTFAYETNEDLKKSIMSLFPEGTFEEEEQEEKPIKSVTEMLSNFKTFAKNIDKNRIFTGIKEVDDRIMLTTGTMNAILGAPGCHAKDTEVLMFDGTIKKVQDVVIGDQLMGPDNKPRRVLDTIKGRETMVKFKPHRSEEFTVNMSHILHLTPSKLKIINRLPGNLNIKVSDYIEGINNKSSTIAGYKLIKSNAIEFSEKCLPIDPYFLGIWLGDGSSNNVAITTMDDEIKNYFIDYVTKEGCTVIRKEQKPNNKSTTYSATMGKGGNMGIIRNSLLNKLVQLNLRDNKHIPNIYLQSSIQQRLQLLAGLMDTDGSLNDARKCYSITQKNKQLAQQIKFLARSLGFHSSIEQRSSYCYYKGEQKTGIYYQVYISGGKLTIPCKLKRKQKIYEKAGTNPLHQGFKYEILPEDDFYGFTVDKDHLYLTADFFIHHNSSKTSLVINMLANTSKAGIHSMFFSLDMSENLLGGQLMRRETDIGFRQLTEAFKNDEDLSDIEKKIEEDFKNVGFYSKSATTVKEMRTQILKHQKNIGQRVKFVVIDYLELIAGPYADLTANSAHHAVQLKDLCTDLDICLLVLVQPQKSAGDASFPLTSMRQVKGASLLEQNFRNILGIYREGFSPDSPELDKFLTIKGLKSTFEGLFSVDVGWDGKTGRVYTLDAEGHRSLKRLREKKEEKKNEDKNDW